MMKMVPVSVQQVMRELIVKQLWLISLQVTGSTAKTCGGNTVTDFTTTFTKTGPNKIQITGFAGFACGGSNILVNCTVNGRDITVDSGQSFCAAQIQISSGSGSLNASGNSISMTYTYTLAGSSSQTCTGTYTK